MADSKTYDRRTVNRYIAKGQVSQEAYTNYLKSLPDEEVNGEWVKLDLVDAEITDDEGIDEGEEEDETY